MIDFLASDADLFLIQWGGLKERTRWEMIVTNIIRLSDVALLIPKVKCFSESVFRWSPSTKCDWGTVFSFGLAWIWTYYPTNVERAFYHYAINAVLWDKELNNSWAR